MYPSVLSNPREEWNVISKVPKARQYLSNRLKEGVKFYSGVQGVHSSGILDAMSLCQVLCGTHPFLAYTWPVFYPNSFKQTPKYTATPSTTLLSMVRGGTAKTEIVTASHTSSPAFQSGTECSMIAGPTVCGVCSKIERFPE
jgi:hypothetical protein